MRYAPLLAAFACYRAGTAAPSDAPPADAIADAPGSNAGPCFGHAPYAVCLDAVPQGTVELGALVSTDNCAQVAGVGSAVVLSVDGADSCVLAGEQILVNATTGVSGSRPLVLVAQAGITIGSGATLDVSSDHTFGRVGPGADACPPGKSGATPSGGGEGGSLQGSGGAPLADPVFHGGCAGGSGGGGAKGGDGGGAVYLVTGTDGTIAVDGAINASGAGGIGGQPDEGGGAGGAGGFVLIDSGTVTLHTMLAIGGGGGAGGDDGGAGESGGDATTTDASASGGSSGTGAGGGPGGGIGGIAGGAGAQGTFSSGGGGGGAGYIEVKASNMVMCGTCFPGITN